MIAWAVSTEGVLTGYTEVTGSQTNSGIAEPDYGTYGVSASLSYYSSQNTSAIIYSYTAEETNVETSTYVTESGITTLETASSQTSTTVTFSVGKTVTYQTTTNALVWTSSQSTSTGSINFYQQAVTADTWTFSTQSTQATRDATTTANGTMIASATALVVQAATGTPNAEVIYYISSAFSWNALSAASAVAQTATRVTLKNIISTIAAPIISVTQSGNDLTTPSFTWNNASSSYSSQFATSTATTSQTTIVTNQSVLPNQTSEDIATVIATTTESSEYNLWASDAGSIGIAGTARTLNSGKSTTSIQEMATSNIAPASSWHGSLTWNVPKTTTVSRGLTTSTSAGYEQVFGRTASNSFTSAIFGGFSQSNYGTTDDVTKVSKNIALVLPQVTTALAQNVSQLKFVPVFAQIADSRGQWFTVANSTFSSASYASISRSLGKTIFPLTTTNESYGLSQISYVSGSGTQSTTTTAALGVEGQSTTTAIGSEIGIIGGAPNLSETFAYGVAQAGLYKNRIDGNTTTLNAGATTFGQSRAASFLEPITALVPVVGTGSTAVFPLYWAVPRNSTALPPAMPPDA